MKKIFEKLLFGLEIILYAALPILFLYFSSSFRNIFNFIYQYVEGIKKKKLANRAKQTKHGHELFMFD